QSLVDDAQHHVGTGGVPNVDRIISIYDGRLPQARSIDLSIEHDRLEGLERDPAIVRLVRETGWRPLHFDLDVTAVRGSQRELVAVSLRLDARQILHPVDRLRERCRLLD